MPRRRRIVLPPLPLHITQRGNDRCVTFRDHIDYATYLRMLRAGCRRADCALHAYALMPNHIHLLVTPVRVDSAARLLQCVGGAYVRYFNDRHSRTGTLWEGRFRSSPVSSDRHLLACYRYIEMNPVRAGLVARANEYRWSSFQRNAWGARDDLVTDHPLVPLSDRNRDDVRSAYLAWFSGPLVDDAFDDIRAATARGRILGRDVRQ